MQNSPIVLRQALLCSPAWQHQDLWRLWCWCLLAAARKARTVLLGQVPTRVAAGQVAAPLAVVCAGTGLTPEAVRECLTIGKSLGLFEVRPTPWGLRITIVNWQDYLRLHPAPPCRRAQALPA